MEAIKFIEFKVDEKGKESTIFINPRYIITFFSHLNSKNKVAISVVSATGYITVNHSFEEVRKMLGLDQ
jgi:hypothetical protein